MEDMRMECVGIPQFPAGGQVPLWVPILEQVCASTSVLVAQVVSDCSGPHGL